MYTAAEWAGPMLCLTLFAQGSALCVGPGLRGHTISCEANASLPECKTLLGQSLAPAVSSDAALNAGSEQSLDVTTAVQPCHRVGGCAGSGGELVNSQGWQSWSFEPDDIYYFSVDISALPN